MKHLKTYENIKSTPKVGDWVIMKADGGWADFIVDYVNNTIFEIVKVEEYETRPYRINLKEGIGNVEMPGSVSEYEGIRLDEIVHFGTKENMLIQQKLDKYNI